MRPKPMKGIAMKKFKLTAIQLYAVAYLIARPNKFFET